MENLKFADKIRLGYFFVSFLVIAMLDMEKSQWYALPILLINLAVSFYIAIDLLIPNKK